MPVNTDKPQPGSGQTRPNQPAEGARHPGNAPGGVMVAPVRHPPVPAEPYDLPPGVHPADQSGPEELESTFHEKSGEPYPKGRKPFAVKNAFAFPINQRAASHFRTGVIAVNANESGTAQVVGRLPGRVSLTLWVPNPIIVGGVSVTPTAGVLFAPTEGEMQGLFGGSILNIGDSVTIESESAVHVGLIPGATVGYVQYLDLFNPADQGISGNT
jgi:hypothetical protein